MIVIILDRDESKYVIDSFLKNKSTKYLEDIVEEHEKRLNRIVIEFTKRIGDLERRLMRLEGKPLWEEGEEDGSRDDKKDI